MQKTNGNVSSNNAMHIQNENGLVGIVQETLNLIVKFLAPKERLRLFAVCKEFKQQLSRECTIWNDVRLSFKFTDCNITRNGITLPNLKDNSANNPDAPPVTLQFIQCETMYCRQDIAKCIEIRVNPEMSKSDPQRVTKMINDCIPSVCSVEIFDNNLPIYDCGFMEALALQHTKYLTVDCFDGESTISKLSRLTRLFPNISYLSILNVDPPHSASIHQVEKGVGAFKRIFSHFAKWKSLRCLQFYECQSVCFHKVVSSDTVLSCPSVNDCIGNVMSLDLSFCAFADILDIQNILDMLPQLKYLSFVSNGIDLKHQQRSLTTMDVDQEFDTLKVPETVEYLKYASTVLTHHRLCIQLDLSALARTQSLRFVDCCIDDMVFLEEMSKHCHSVQFISLLYDRDSTEFLNKHWIKYSVHNIGDDVRQKPGGLQIAVQFVDGAVEDKKPLKHFLRRLFSFESGDVITRNALYRNYFNSTDSRIVEMKKVNEATDFFHW